MKGRKSNAILTQALTAVCCLNHRGAAGAEADTGDGAGVTIQTPDAFFRAVVPFELPPAGAYATGIAFLPVDDPEGAVRAVEKVLLDEGFTVLGWRDVPVEADVPGKSAREVMPAFRQVFVEKAGIEGRRARASRVRRPEAHGARAPGDARRQRRRTSRR